MNEADERPVLLSGSAHPRLAGAIASELGLAFGDPEVGAHPDGEIHVEVRQRVAGRHVVLVQPTAAPAERHLLELCLLSDACRRAGAERVTAVVPYFGYARHDHRGHEGAPIGVRVVTDLLAAARIERVLGVDVHCGAIEALSSVPFEHLSAEDLLLAALGPHPERDRVVVAPDLGAAKLAQRVGRALDAPVAFVHKLRRSGLDVEAAGVTGEVRDRRPLIVDDMIATAGTIEAAASALLAAGCKRSISLFATHGLFVGPAFERLRALPIDRVLVTDSVPERAAAPFPVERVSIASMLARAIDAVHLHQPLESLISHG